MFPALIGGYGVHSPAKFTYYGYPIALAVFREANSVDSLFAMRAMSFDDLRRLGYLFKRNQN